jgi:hypothetical protein
MGWQRRSEPLQIRQISHRLGNGKRLVFGPWHVASPPPEATPPVERIDIPDQPAPSLHPHPRSAGASPLLRAGPPASAASVLSGFGGPPRLAPSRDLGGLRPRSPYRCPPSHVPCQSRGPGSRRASSVLAESPPLGSRDLMPLVDTSSESLTRFEKPLQLALSVDESRVASLHAVVRDAFSIASTSSVLVMVVHSLIPTLAASSTSSGLS